MLRHQFIILAALIAIITCPFSAFAYELRYYSPLPTVSFKYSVAVNSTDFTDRCDPTDSGIALAWSDANFTNTYIEQTISSTSLSIDYTVLSHLFTGGVEPNSVFIGCYNEFGMGNNVHSLAMFDDFLETPMFRFGAIDELSTTTVTSADGAANVTMFGFLLMFMTMFFIVWSFKKRT